METTKSASKELTPKAPTLTTKQALVLARKLLSEKRFLETRTSQLLTRVFEPSERLESERAQANYCIVLATIAREIVGSTNKIMKYQEALLESGINGVESLLDCDSHSLQSKELYQERYEISLAYQAHWKTRKTRVESDSEMIRENLDSEWKAIEKRFQEYEVARDTWLDNNTKRIRSKLASKEKEKEIEQAIARVTRMVDHGIMLGSVKRLLERVLESTRESK